jgi:hypothetical protein
LSRSFCVAKNLLFGFFPEVVPKSENRDPASHEKHYHTPAQLDMHFVEDQKLGLIKVQQPPTSDDAEVASVSKKTNLSN